MTVWFYIYNFFGLVAHAAIGPAPAPFGAARVLDIAHPFMALGRKSSFLPDGTAPAAFISGPPFVSAAGLLEHILNPIMS